MMWELPRNWHKTRWSPRLRYGRSQAFRTIRAPGSWPRPSTERSIGPPEGGLRPQARRSRTGRRGCASPEPAEGDAIDDDILRLIFTACHPVLTPEARVALTLRLVGGLRTEEIAHAFLTSESTVAQRIVGRSERSRPPKSPSRFPYGDERSARVSSVLEVIYLIFNEGYSATAGDDLTRPGLCEDALRLARQLSALMPVEPEVHGLEALLEFQASRIAARTGPEGEPVLLADQNRSRWNRMLIKRGIRALELAGDGPYSIQAAIAGCHATAIRYADTDWATIAQLYRRLTKLTPSPVVELNGRSLSPCRKAPKVGLELLDSLAAEPSLQDYHLLPSVRGDLLQRLGRTEERVPSSRKRPR